MLRDAHARPAALAPRELLGQVGVLRGARGHRPPVPQRPAAGGGRAGQRDRGAELRARRLLPGCHSGHHRGHGVAAAPLRVPGPAVRGHRDGTGLRAQDRRAVAEPGAHDRGALRGLREGHRHRGRRGAPGHPLRLRADPGAAVGPEHPGEHRLRVDAAHRRGLLPRGVVCDLRCPEPDEDQQVHHRPDEQDPGPDGALRLRPQARPPGNAQTAEHPRQADSGRDPGRPRRAGGPHRRLVPRGRQRPDPGRPGPPRGRDPQPLRLQGRPGAHRSTVARRPRVHPR